MKSRNQWRYEESIFQTERSLVVRRASTRVHMLHLPMEGFLAFQLSLFFSANMKILVQIGRGLWKTRQSYPAWRLPSPAWPARYRSCPCRWRDRVKMLTLLRSPPFQLEVFRPAEFYRAFCSATFCRSNLFVDLKAKWHEAEATKLSNARCPVRALGECDADNLVKLNVYQNFLGKMSFKLGFAKLYFKMCFFHWSHFTTSCSWKLPIEHPHYVLRLLQMLADPPIRRPLEQRSHLQAIGQVH